MHNINTHKMDNNIKMKKQYTTNTRNIYMSTRKSTHEEIMGASTFLNHNRADQARGGAWNVIPGQSLSVLRRPALHPTWAGRRTGGQEDWAHRPEDWAHRARRPPPARRAPSRPTAPPNPPGQDSRPASVPVPGCGTRAPDPYVAPGHVHHSNGLSA